MLDSSSPILHPYFLSTAFKSADEVLDGVSPDHLESLEIKNSEYLRDIHLQQTPQSSQKFFTGCQEGLSVQETEDMELSEGFVENELVRPRQAQLCLDLIKILLACFSLCEEFLAQTFWIPIPVSLFHLHHIE